MSLGKHQRPVGCTVGCLAIWVGLVWVLYLMRRGSDGFHPQEVLDAISAIGWAGAVIGVWDATNIEGAVSYHCGSCGTSTATRGICPNCGVRLVPSPEVQAREELKGIIAGGVAVSLMGGLLAFLATLPFHGIGDRGPLSFGALVFGLLVFVVMVWYSLRRRHF